MLLLCPALLPAQQTVDRRFPVNADVSIRIYLPSGRAVVSGWDRDTIAVTARIPPGGGSFFGGGRGGAAKLGIEGDESGAAPGSEFRVQVPRRARLWIKSATASVEVLETQGELDVLSVNGSIVVRGQPSIASLESIDGPITVEAGAPVLRARTSGGRVSVRAKAGDLSVETVSGGIEVACPVLDRGRLETIGGAIRFTGNLAPSASLETETHGADIHLQFTGPINGEFRLASPGGGVVNRLDGPGRLVKGAPATFLVGTPSATITARSLKGTVTVSR
jgi:hypothetical protein